MEEFIVLCIQSGGGGGRQRGPGEQGRRGEELRDRGCVGVLGVLGVCDVLDGLAGCEEKEAGCEGGAQEDYEDGGELVVHFVYRCDLEG